jgi:hypothetical protein
MSRTMRWSVYDNFEKEFLVADAAPNPTHARTQCKPVPFRYSGAF